MRHDLCVSLCVRIDFLTHKPPTGAAVPSQVGTLFIAKVVEHSEDGGAGLGGKNLF